MNIKATLKKIMLLAAVSAATVSVQANGPTAVTEAANTEMVTKGGPTAAEVAKWAFEKEENTDLMDILGKVARKADPGTMQPIVEALETGVKVRDLRKGYKDGVVKEEAFLSEADQLVSDVAGLLQFLSMARTLMEESFEKSQELELARYTTHDPLLQTLIGLEQEEQSKKLHEAMKDVNTALEVLDQVMAIREGLVFNAPSGLMRGVAIYFGRNKDGAPSEKVSQKELRQVHKELAGLGMGDVSRLFS